jgi:hypothetical protein
MKAINKKKRGSYQTGIIVAPYPALYVLSLGVLLSPELNQKEKKIHTLALKYTHKPCMLQHHSLLIKPIPNE